MHVVVTLHVLFSDPPSSPLNVFTIQVGPTWALTVWTRPADNGSFPLSMYLLSASPQSMEYQTSTSEILSPSEATKSNLEDTYSVLDRGFATNTACIEHVCEVTHMSVNVRIGAQQAANVTGLIPAVNYSLVVFAFSNGSNLQSGPSLPIYFVTDEHGMCVCTQNIPVMLRPFYVHDNVFILLLDCVFVSL